MKVVLLNDIKGLGVKGQTVNVSAGYFANFLSARGWAAIDRGQTARAAKQSYHPGAGGQKGSKPPAPKRISRRIKRLERQKSD